MPLAVRIALITYGVLFCLLVIACIAAPSVSYTVTTVYAL